MIEILEEQFWQFVSIFLAIIAIIITIALYRLQRKNKELSYDIITSTAILSIDEGVKDKFKILYESKEIKNSHMLIIKIKNTGNIPILESEYQKPIVIKFGKKTRILSTEIIETSPDDIDLKLKQISNSKTQLEPTLLNERDSFTIKFILTEFENDIRFQSRIVGINKIKEITESTYQYITTFIGTPIIIIGFSLLLGFPQYETYGLIFLFIGYGLVLGGALSNEKMRNKILTALKILSTPVEVNINIQKAKINQKGKKN